MQESISQLQGQVGQMAELVSRSSDAYCLASTQSLQHLAGLQKTNAEQAQQVCMHGRLHAMPSIQCMLA